MGLRIREIIKSDEKKIMEMYNEYMNSQLIPGIDRFEGIRDFEKLGSMSFQEWCDYLEINKDVTQLPENYSTHTLYIALDENECIIGALGLRWLKIPQLVNYGGFIGYSIRPKARAKGYGTELLKLGIEEYKKINNDKVLVTCKDFNIPSKKVIEKNGGIYENSFYNEKDGYTYLRFWIF